MTNQVEFYSSIAVKRIIESLLSALACVSKKPPPMFEHDVDDILNNQLPETDDHEDKELRKLVLDWWKDWPKE